MRRVEVSISNIKTTYDSYGRVKYENWHTGFGLHNVYNSYGYLSEVKTQNNISVWSNATYNARGQVTGYDLGDDYEATRVWDSYGFPSQIKTKLSGTSTYIDYLYYDFDEKRGNLMQRETWKYYKFEKFRYDKLNRLRADSLGSTNYRNTEYADNGNITNRSDIGDYAYTQQDAGPHAFTGLSNTTGNLLPATSQTVDYTAFNKASHISQGSLDYFITYGPDRLRRKTLLQSGLTDETLLTKYYALGDYEKETDANGTRHLHYISAGDGLAAIYVKNEGGTDSLYFILKDHLGSIVGAINEETGKVYRQSFDAWGRNRNPENWTYSNIPDFIFDRGFTGHEHLKWFGLINMNGRMYDAAVCRFLSPDPYVQMPDNTQNLNRYSYALNNPLIYTDPDGEFIISALIIGALANVAIQGLSGNINNVGDALLAAGIGAVAGAAGAYLAGAACVSMGLSATGVTSGVVWGGTAGLSGGFISGAGNSWAGGSNFGDGLVDGLSAGGFGMMTGGIMGGVGGGLSAIKNNRDFWSGAPNLSGGVEVSQVNLPGSALSYKGYHPRLQPMLQGSELVYDDEINALQWVDLYSDGSSQIKDQFCSVAGPNGKRRLLEGVYSVKKIQLFDSDKRYVRDGFGFFADLDPEFKLPSGRCCFEIHPDGHNLGQWWVNNGTGGCIGLQENASGLTRFYNLMSKYLSRNSSIKVYAF